MLSPHSGKNILVVEDDEATREALALALEADGHCTARAANGREALDLLREGPHPDLILLDLAMPVLDGWQFRRQQQQDGALASIPVVVLSGASDLPGPAVGLGVEALLQKPLELDRLREVIRPFVTRQPTGGRSAPDGKGRGLSARLGASAGTDLRAPTAVSLRHLEEVGDILEAVTSAMAGEGFSAQDVFGMRLALEEALVNAIKHGHGGDPGKRVRVRYRVTAAQALVEVEDQGPGFDPSGVPDPLAPENLERPSGRGLCLMRHYLSWVRHNERGNTVTLCKMRSAPSDACPRRNQ